MTQIARMPDKDMEVLGKVLTATWEEREFASLALDEIMEMFNRVIKQSLTKVSQAYMVKLAPIVEHRKHARSQVVSRFYKPTKERDPVAVLVRDRHTAVQAVMPFVKTSRVFSDDGKGRLVSLSGMVARKEVVEEMLRARQTSLDLWKQVFGKGPTREKIRTFAAQNTTSVSSNARRRKSQAQKEWEDASVLAKQYHQVVVTVLDHLEWSPERRAEIAQMIGACSASRPGPPRRGSA